MGNSANDRLIWVDFIRVVSAFLVIGIHVGDVYSESTPDLAGHVNWLVVNFFDNFLRCAVPFFVMISGYLLLHKKKPLENTIATRVLRVIVALIVWSVIYLLVRKIYFGTTIDGQPVTVYTGIQCFLTGKASIHLWFLYMICALYLVAPILQSYLQSASRRNIRYFIRLWWFAVLIWPILSMIVTTCFDIQRINFDFYIVTQFVGYFVAGYYYGDKAISGKTCTAFVVLLLTLSVSVTLAIYCTGNHEFGRLELFSRLESAFVVPFFMVLKYFGSSSRLAASSVVPMLHRVAALTFGIYVAHILVLRMLSDGILGFSLSVASLTAVISLPLVTFVIFLLTAVVVFLGRKTPVLRRIFL